MLLRDALGARVSRTSAGVNRQYVWNYALDLPSVSAIRDDSGDLRYYVYLPDGTLLYSIDSNTEARQFFHFDEVGSTMFLSDDAGAITDTYAADPIGEDLVHSGPADNPFTFQGAHSVMQEGATGLYYMGTRYYDSSSARFLSPDSRLLLPSLNPYQYAMQNPLAVIDPRGRGSSSKLAEGGDFNRFVLALPQKMSKVLGSGLSGTLKLIRALLETLSPQATN